MNNRFKLFPGDIKVSVVRTRSGQRGKPGTDHYVFPGGVMIPVREVKPSHIKRYFSEARASLAKESKIKAVPKDVKNNEAV